jgi:hypothetical protein
VVERASPRRRPTGAFATPHRMATSRRSTSTSAHGGACVFRNARMVSNGQRRSLFFAISLSTVTAPCRSAKRIFGSLATLDCQTDKISTMPTKAKKNRNPKGAATPIVELVVRRGALRRFHKLKRATANLPVKLSWDKRRRDRRTSASDVEGKRRQVERRKKPPFTWDVADFVVAEAPTRQRSVKIKRDLGGQLKTGH